MFDGRVFVITGATGATGRAAARALAARGASLALIGTDLSRLGVLAGDLNLPAARLLTLTADLRNGPAVHSAAEAVTAKFGRLDGLIHLVGGWIGGKTIAESSADDFESKIGRAPIPRNSTASTGEGEKPPSHAPRMAGAPPTRPITASCHSAGRSRTTGAMIPSPSVMFWMMKPTTRKAPSAISPTL